MDVGYAYLGRDWEFFSGSGRRFCVSMMLMHSCSPAETNLNCEVPSGIRPGLRGSGHSLLLILGPVFFLLVFVTASLQINKLRLAVLCIIKRLFLRRTDIRYFEGSSELPLQ